VEDEALDRVLDRVLEVWRTLEENPVVNGYNEGAGLAAAAYSLYAGDQFAGSFRGGRYSRREREAGGFSGGRRIDGGAVRAQGLGGVRLS